MSDDDAPMTDDELDALDAEIASDMAVSRAMNDAVIAKVRRFRAALAQRNQQSATVHEIRPREPEPGDFRPRPAGPQPPFVPGPDESQVRRNGGDDFNSAST
jgi:hypothetical protein